MKIDIKIMNAFWHLYENDGTKKIFGLYGGRGSGKSYAMGDLIAYRGTFEKHRILCCREIQKSIAESSKKVVENRIEKMGLAKFWDFGRSYTRCKLSGSEIIYEGLKFNTEKIKSMEDITIAWSEESENLTEESITLLEPTVLRANGARLYYTFNPRFSHDPIYRRYVLKKNPNADFRLVNYNSNKYFPESLEELRLYSQRTEPELYRWIWEGEPMGESSSALISSAIVAKAVNRIPVQDYEEPLIGALDIARQGDDRSALVIRDRNRIERLKVWKIPTMEGLCAVVAEEIFASGCHKLIIDGAGIGAPYIEPLQRMLPHCEIVSFNGGFAPIDGQRYYNARTECWDRLRYWVEHQGQIFDNDELKADLLSVQKTYDKTNRLLLESKETMKKRGLRSPDLGDALSMTFYQGKSSNFKNEELALALMGGGRIGW